MTFTNEQQEILEKEAAALLEDIAQGKNVRDVMAQIYVEKLDEKTIQQGELMADKILQNVKDFDASYQEAQENLDRFVEKFQSKMDKGKSCVDRCNYWLKLGTVVSSLTTAMSEGEVDRERIIREADALSVSEEDATPKLEAELREQAATAIKNSGILLGTLAEQTEALEKLDSAEEAAGLLIDMSGHEMEYRAVVSMLAYTMSKNGELEGVPVDMTASQVTAMVCAGLEQTRIMKAVGDGKMAEDIAAILLGILGSVLLLLIALPVFAFTTQAILELFIPILAIPLGIMAVVGLYHLFNAAVDRWIEDSKSIAGVVVSVVRTVVKGIKAVVEFIARCVLPKVVEIATDVLAKLKKLAAGIKGEVRVDNTVSAPQ